MTFSIPFGRTRKSDDSSRIGFNLELSFQLESELEVTQRRRLLLVTEAFKSIADRDDRLAWWFVLPLQADGWVRVRAVICAKQPGEAAALSEQWMASAISAANLADDPDAARMPTQRTQAELLAEPGPLATLTAQVSADSRA